MKASRLYLLVMALCILTLSCAVADKIKDGGGVITPGEAKALKSGESALVGGYVTAIFGDYDCFVIESSDGTSALTVNPLAESISIGSSVVVGGTFNGETLAMESVGLLSGTLVLNPLLMTNREITGILGDPGLATRDLLVTTTGVALDGPTAFADGSVRFHISDGSAGSGGPTAVVQGSGASETVPVTAIQVVIPPSAITMRGISKGSSVTVTGIVSKGSTIKGKICSVVARDAAAISTGSGTGVGDDPGRFGLLYTWTVYDASTINLGNATIGNTIDLVPNGGATEMAASFAGRYSANKVRTALDLRPPSETWGPGYVTEFCLYGEGDGGGSYSRLNVGWGSYMYGCYSISEEAGGSQAARPVNLGIADHTNGWNRESIRLSDSNGAVIMGENAQKTSESVVDYDPIDMLTLHPPLLASAGTKDSHGLVLSGNGYDNANHKADWRMKTNVTSQAGASSFLLQNRVDAASYTTRLSVDDGGRLSVNRINIGSSSTLSVSSNTITVSRSFHLINAPSANVTVNTINGGSAGDIVYFKKTGAYYVSFPDVAGNVDTLTGVTLNNVCDIIGFLYDGTTWVELSFSDNN